MTFKILIIHSSYRNLHLSGENNVVEMQAAFLKTIKGVEVKIVNQKISLDSINPIGKFKLALRVACGYGENPLKIAKKFDPNLVIVHNLFPNFGTRWLKRVDIPTVLYLHNYRNFCASGNFFREDKICHLCVTKTPLYAIRYSCYRNSKLATLPLVLKQIREHSRGPKVSKSVKYVCVSGAIASSMEKSGIQIGDIAILENFVEFEQIKNSQITSSLSALSWVAVGRLVEEKGFGKLIENWPDGANLDIVGDGPGRLNLEKLIQGRKNIRLLGTLSKLEISEKLPTYSGAIIPSIWEEGSPLTEIEFRRAGLPVIQVRRPGAQIENDQNLLIPYEDFINNQAKKHFVIALQYVLSNRFNLSIQSRRKFETDYSPNAWLKKFNNILENWFELRIN